MRPRHTPNTPYEPPRWRNKRTRDLREIAAAYAAAIMAIVALLSVIAAFPDWFLGAGDGFTVTIHVALAVTFYIACGALLVSFAASRIAAWESIGLTNIPVMRWYTFLAWPILMGIAVYRISNPHRVLT